jgi:hypothetical protein
MDEHLCEVCSQPMPPGSTVLRVGACEFPFYVHDGCRDHLGPLADEIALMCSAAEEQPDGLLWLGSWDPLSAETEQTEQTEQTGQTGQTESEADDATP